MMGYDAALLPFLRQQKGDAASAARRRGGIPSFDLNPLQFPLEHQGGGMLRALCPPDTSPAIGGNLDIRLRGDGGDES